MTVLHSLKFAPGPHKQPHEGMERRPYVFSPQSLLTAHGKLNPHQGCPTCGFPGPHVKHTDTEQVRASFP